MLKPLKYAFDSLTSHISLHPRQWFFISMGFFVNVIIFSFPRAPHLSVSTRFLFPFAVKSTVSGDPDLCKNGKVYVYDLPEMFNRDLLIDCDDLNIWNWQCGIGTNGGYGRRATEIDRIVPVGVAPAWYRTNQFSSEVIFHNRIMNYSCRTLEPESATAFYIPFYGGLAVGKYLFGNHSEEERDFLCNMTLSWLQDQPYWRRSNGADHFLVLGRITWDFRRLMDFETHWGSSFLNLPVMQNTTRLLIERNSGDYYDVGVPYPTGFHPHTAAQLSEWQNFVRTRNRTHLTSFVGATRNRTKTDIREILLSQCKSESDTCRLVDCAITPCANDSAPVLEAMLDSDFCLQPKGDSATRRSVFDCMIAGSIPVFFWKETAYLQYGWFLPAETESYSIFIDHNVVMNGKSVRRVLEKYNREKVRRMREKVIEYLPNIVYAKASGGLKSYKDAFDIAVDGVLGRFKDAKRQKNWWYVNGM